jgi:hypothetical protein
MKKTSVVAVLCFSLTLLIAATAGAQSTAKPYHNGPVWDIAFIKVHAGMDDRYLRYVVDQWKPEQEALKKAGYVLDYMVIQTESHGPQDYDLMLMTKFKDLATMEANEDKMEDIALQLVGGRTKDETGYQERASYREIIGSRIGREIILEPTPAGK